MYPGPPVPRRTGGQVAGGVVMLVVGALALLGGGVLLLAGLLVSHQNSTLRSRGLHAEGIVISHPFPLRAKIEYTTQTGQRFIGEMADPHSSDELSDGNVDVIYDPLHPDHAEIAHLVEDSKTIDVILVVMGGMGLVIGLLLLVGGVLVLVRKPRAPAMAPGYYPPPPPPSAWGAPPSSWGPPDSSA